MGELCTECHYAYTGSDSADYVVDGICKGCHRVIEYRAKQRTRFESACLDAARILRQLTEPGWDANGAPV